MHVTTQAPTATMAPKGSTGSLRSKLRVHRYIDVLMEQPLGPPMVNLDYILYKLRFATTMSRALLL